MRASVAVALALILQVQPPPRDTPASPRYSGSGVIRGRVVAADTGQPIRQATVMLMYAPRTVLGQAAPRSGAPSTLRPQQVQSDETGRFEFAHLPEGTYRLTATAPPHSGQYLGQGYGVAVSPGPGIIQGKAIELAPGEIFEKAIIELPRGGVISGRVLDEAGFPLARIQIAALLYAIGSTRGQRSAWGASTDDRGEFRVFGLSPGEYAIVAESRQPFSSGATAGPEQMDEERSGYLTTFYPSAIDEASAGRIHVAGARETPGVEIRMVAGRLYRVSGTVVDSRGQPAASVEGQFVRPVAGTVGFSSLGFTTDAEGRFLLQNLPTGEYRISIRHRRPATPGSAGPPPDPEVALMPIVVGAASTDNLVVTLAPGASVTGRIVFEPAVPDNLPSGGLQIALVSPDPGAAYAGINPPPVQAKSDRSFTIKGVVGDCVVRVSGMQPSWYVKSATAGDQDALDAPRTFKQGDDLRVVISTRGAALEGTVKDDKGEPVSDAGIVLFSEDRSGWRTTALTTKRTVAGAQGQFRMIGLRPGRYRIIALERERMTGPLLLNEPSYFEALANVATAIVVNEDELRTLELHLSAR